MFFPTPSLLAKVGQLAMSAVTVAQDLFGNVENTDERNELKREHATQLMCAGYDVADEFIGLSDEADKFLKENVFPAAIKHSVDFFKFIGVFPKDTPSN